MNRFQASLARSLHRPFTAAELTARQRATNYLEIAKSYHDMNDHPNAASCCLEGLYAAHGISRPLAVRDQLHDLFHALDPAARKLSMTRC